MKTLLKIAVAGVLLAAASVSSAEAQRGQFITRTTIDGKTMVLPLPRTRAECLDNRRKLGYNIKKHGAGVCNQFFPK